MTLFNFSGAPGELEARLALCRLGEAPVLGQDFEVLLLAGQKVLSSPGSGKDQRRGSRRKQLLAIGDEQLSTIQSYIAGADADFLAVVLPEADRVALIAPCTADLAGQAAVLLPYVGASSVLRVLRHAFSDRVRIVGQEVPQESAMRAVDEHTYQYLQQLLMRWHVVLGIEGASHEITDRRQLSLQVLGIFRAIQHLLGVPVPGADMREFPIAFPYRGVFRPTLALWMQLLLILGLRRGFGESVWQNARLFTEDELLLPCLEIPVGNRTRLPTEWEECARLARRYGMFFDICRKRDAVRVRFCPMTPYTSPDEFYSVRAMAPIIEGIREMKFE